MLKLSTRSRYGLRAMVQLAGHFGRAPLNLAAISEEQGISRKYLHALLTALKDDGLLRSVRGAQGGYVLTRDPAKTTVAEVVEILEGALAPVDCVTNHAICGRARDCKVRPLWESLRRAMMDVLEKTTLADLSGTGSRR